MLAHQKIRYLMISVIRQNSYKYEKNGIFFVIKTKISTINRKKSTQTMIFGQWTLQIGS